MTDDCGQVFFCRQLHVLFISVAVVVAVSLACGGDSIRLLWLSIICLVFFFNSGTTVIGLPLLWYPCLIKHALFFVSVIYLFLYFSVSCNRRS